MPLTKTRKLYFKGGTFVIDTHDKDVQWATERRPHKSVVHEAKMLAKNKQ